MRSPYAPPQPKDQDRHNAAGCRNCGAKIKTRRRGRKARYCSDRCRVDANRQLNFPFANVSGENENPAAGALKKPARYPHSRLLRNAKNFLAISNGCKHDFAGRGSAVNGLLRSIIDVEVIAPHAWIEVTSTDGVVSFVAILRPRALREGGSSGHG